MQMAQSNVTVQDMGSSYQTATLNFFVLASCHGATVEIPLDTLFVDPLTIQEL